MFLRGLARPLMMAAKLKVATGIVGPEVVPNAREVLIGLYTKTLEEIKAVPEVEGYRKAVENLTCHRLQVCKEEEDSESIEKRLGGQRVEELIEEAQDELQLIGQKTRVEVKASEASSNFSDDDLVVGKTTGGVYLRAVNMAEAFISAARFGDLQKLKRLAKKLKDGGQNSFEKITDRDGGHTALHYAAKYGNVDICDYLIKELKVDVNVEDEAGNTPLHSATKMQQLQAAINLMENGALLDKANKEGMMPLHCALATGANELMRLFVSSGANVEPNSFIMTPLSYASHRGDKEAVEFLLKNNANPNRATDFTSPLSEASKSSLECADLLINAGADPNITISGLPPLHAAASAQKVEIVQYLLKAGANPNILDELGFTPLEIAALRGNSEATSVLFAVTSPIPSIPDWSVSGVTAYMKSKQVSEKISAAVKQVISSAKSKGSDSVKRESYMEAAMWYSKALSYDPSDVEMLSDRSFCFACMVFLDEALSDAKTCVRLKPEWPEAHYREGVAWELMGRNDQAAKSLARALELDPNNKEIEKALREVVEGKYIRAVLCRKKTC